MLKCENRITKVKAKWNVKKWKVAYSEGSITEIGG